MSWIVSTEDKRWTECDNYSESKGEEIIIGEERGKPLFGFGTCMSEVGCKVINELSEEKKNAVYDDLFGEGFGFDYCRLSVGANDFALGWYSYNETEGDYAMEHFSIDRDKRYIIPAVKKAMERSHELRFFASPWSPPTWMKLPPVYNYGKMVMTDENLRAYALYFKKFIEAYRNEGINIAQLHPQNEIHADQKFPSCVWSGEDFARFIADYLIPELGDMVDIWYGTVNGPSDGPHLKVRHNKFLNLAMQNEVIRNNIKGVSYQWGGKIGLLNCEEDYPQLDTINSEWECGEGKNTWDYAMYGFEMWRHYFAHGSRACVYWNIALDRRQESTWGWGQNSLMTIDGDNVTYNPDYYMVKHFANKVHKGAVMLKTRGGMSSNTCVFRNTDGSRVAVIMNPFEFEKTVTIEDKNYILKPKSFNTIVL
ncbi:MAG: glycosyl hydrolase [Clostridia bacterium]|nr:glycosyl hydrolase [Clostridia bacterium]